MQRASQQESVSGSSVSAGGFLLCTSEASYLTFGPLFRSNTYHVPSQTSTDVTSKRKSTGLKGKDVILEYYNVGPLNSKFLLSALAPNCLR